MTTKTGMRLVWRVIIYSVGIMPVAAQAALLNWTDPSPSPSAGLNLSAQKLAALAQNDILIYSQPTQPINLDTRKGKKAYQAQFVHAAIVVNATPAQIQQFLSQPTQFVGSFPTLTRATVLQQHGNVSQVRYHISIPSPIKLLSFNQDVTLQHHLDAGLMRTTIIESPFPYGIGTLRWSALDQQRSLLTLTQWADLNTTNSWLIGTLLNAMPEARSGIPYGTSAFVMETLKRKFNGTPAMPVQPSGSVPQKHLTPSQLQSIVQLSQQSGSAVSFVHDRVAVPYQHGNEALRFTSSYQYLNTSPQRAAALIQPQIFKTLFPRLIRQSPVVAVANGHQDILYRGSAGLRVINIPFNIRMRAVAVNPQTTDLYAVGGDLKFVRTRMSIQPLENGTLWQMSATVKVDPAAPYLLRVVRNLPYDDMLPGATMAQVIHEQSKRTLGF